MAYFALSFDHRIIDGADAERFLTLGFEQRDKAQTLVRGIERLSHDVFNLGPPARDVVRC